jgi:hypothetical protein
LVALGRTELAAAITDDPTNNPCISNSRFSFSLMVFAT